MWPACTGPNKELELGMILRVKERMKGNTGSRHLLITSHSHTSVSHRDIFTSAHKCVGQSYFSHLNIEE